MPVADGAAEQPSASNEPQRSSSAGDTSSERLVIDLNAGVRGCGSPLKPPASTGGLRGGASPALGADLLLQRPDNLRLLASTSVAGAQVEESGCVGADARLPTGPALSSAPSSRGRSSATPPSAAATIAASMLLSTPTGEGEPAAPAAPKSDAKMDTVAGEMAQPTAAGCDAAPATPAADTAAAPVPAAAAAAGGCKSSSKSSKKKRQGSQQPAASTASDAAPATPTGGTGGNAKKTPSKKRPSADSPAAAPAAKSHKTGGNSSKRSHGGSGGESSSTQQRRDRSTCVRSVAAETDAELLGACEPGTHVALDGVVWNELPQGMLVVNVTWRGKSYVGTLLDCTKYDWAPPRNTDSPLLELNVKTPNGHNAAAGVGPSAAGAGACGNGSSRGSKRSYRANAAGNDLRKSASSSAVGAGPSRMKNGVKLPTQSNHGSGSDDDSSHTNEKTPMAETALSEPVSPLMHACPCSQCEKSFHSEAAVKFHQNDSHRPRGGASPAAAQASPSTVRSLAARLMSPPPPAELIAELSGLDAAQADGLYNLLNSLHQRAAQLSGASRQDVKRQRTSPSAAYSDISDDAPVLERATGVGDTGTGSTTPVQSSRKRSPRSARKQLVGTPVTVAGSQPPTEVKLEPSISLPMAPRAPSAARYHQQQPASDTAAASGRPNIPLDIKVPSSLAINATPSTSRAPAGLLQQQQTGNMSTGQSLQQQHRPTVSLSTSTPTTPSTSQQIMFGGPGNQSLMTPANTSSQGTQQMPPMSQASHQSASEAQMVAAAAAAAQQQFIMAYGQQLNALFRPSMMGAPPMPPVPSMQSTQPRPNQSTMTHSNTLAQHNGMNGASPSAARHSHQQQQMHLQQQQQQQHKIHELAAGMHNNNMNKNHMGARPSPVASTAASPLSFASSQHGRPSHSGQGHPGSQQQQQQQQSSGAHGSSTLGRSPSQHRPSTAVAGQGGMPMPGHALPPHSQMAAAMQHNGPNMFAPGFNFNGMGMDALAAQLLAANQAMSMMQPK